MPPVRQTAERKPIAHDRARARLSWTFDLGQNMVGVVRLKVTAPAGTRLTLRHAEMLNPDGTVYTANLRAAVSTDTYVCRGGGEEIWQPRFTFHGFRYVELTGLPEQARRRRGDRPSCSARTTRARVASPVRTNGSTSSFPTSSGRSVVTT